MAPLRVLITCRELAVRAGSQLYTRDVAEELRRLGHSPVVYSPRPGEVAADLRSRGIAVIGDLDRLGAPPSVIHGQHHQEAMAAMLRFPGVPALYVCHGWLPWEEAPPRFPSLLRYVAVDALRRDRLVLEHGIPEERVSVLSNFVDLDRFRPRPPLPERPRRALLLSNQASSRTFVPRVERACAASGLELTVAGFAAGRPEARPEEILRSFDIVFARGRSALEAMAVGAAVVLCDVEGCGPLVGSGDFDRLRALNFGMGALRPPVEEGKLLTEIARYDPDDAARVRDRVRREAGRTEAVALLVELYEDLLAAAPALSGDGHARACLEAASRYLSWLGPAVDTGAERLATAGRDLENAKRDLGAAEEELTSARRELSTVMEVLQTLERSPFSRLRGHLLGMRSVAALHRLLTRRGSNRSS